jgi:DMSO/TMAO reductase YedYZ molybdopterin-dependent catalytic subunit
MKGIPLALVMHPLLRGHAWAEAPNKLIKHDFVALVLEMPLSNLNTWITPNDLFPVLTIMANPLPAIAPKDWKLKVEGLVDKPVALSYDQLKALPSKKVTAILECAGNSRNSVSPPLERTFLNSGYVGNAEWKGVPLRAVLEKAGVKGSAIECVLEGADRGKPYFAPEVEANFAKSVPLEKALHPDTLLVYEMNGVPLPREHGGPVRMLVPGWYGTYNVKWISRIELIDKPFDGVFMTRSWRVRRQRDGHVREESVSTIGVKSLIASPAAGQKLAVGSHRITGAAWSGGKDITSVRVSTDGGKNWHFAKLDDRSGPYSWRLWEHKWDVREKGQYTIIARATDTSGTAQPFAYELDLNGFHVNQVHQVNVEVS